MESSLLEFGDSELDKSAADRTGDTAVTDRRYSLAAPAEQPESDLALEPVPLGRRTIWREMRVKLLPTVVFLLIIAAIIYLWPPF